MTVAVAVGAGPTAVAAGPTTWFVSAATGADAATCGSSASSACKTIGQAVSNSAAGDIVSVAAGVYAEQVTVAKQLTLVGPGVGQRASGRAQVVPPASVNNGFLLNPGSAGSTVDGFWVHGAQGEGILAMNTRQVTITSNRVEGNDLGAQNSSTTYPECQAQGPIPGDCGEGIHLWSTTNSTVVWNQVLDNSGGILLTDETGPTANNLVAHNDVFDNADDCGITVVGHSNKAFVNGALDPAAAGVYGNTITANTVNDNGLIGQGAGIILAGAGPGTAVYRNTVSSNVARDNGLAGVTLHSHAPGQFMDSNAIINNYFDRNDTTGGVNNGPGDSDTGDQDGNGSLMQSADIIIFSAVDLVKFTTITGNTFADAQFGVWTHNAPSLLRRNTFGSSVTTNVLQNPSPVSTKISGPATAALNSTIALSGKAQGSVPVIVQYEQPGHTWLILGRTTSTAAGAWTLHTKLRFPKEYFRAFAYGSLSNTLTVRAQ